MRCKPTCFTCLLIQIRENPSSIIHHSTQSVGWLDASVQHAALGALTDASALRRRRHETQAREVPTHHYNFRTWWKGINSILCLWGTWSTSSSTVSAHIFITDAWIYVFAMSTHPLPSKHSPGSATTPLLSRPGPSTRT